VLAGGGPRSTHCIYPPSAATSAFQSLRQRRPHQLMCFLLRTPALSMANYGQPLPFAGCLYQIAGPQQLQQYSFGCPTVRHHSQQSSKIWFRGQLCTHFAHKVLQTSSEIMKRMVQRSTSLIAGLNFVCVYLTELVLRLCGLW